MTFGLNIYEKKKSRRQAHIQKTIEINFEVLAWFPNVSKQFSHPPPSPPPPSFGVSRWPTLQKWRALCKLWTRIMRHFVPKTSIQISDLNIYIENWTPYDPKKFLPLFRTLNKNVYSSLGIFLAPDGIDFF